MKLAAGLQQGRAATISRPNQSLLEDILENKNGMTEYDLAWNVLKFVYDKFPGDFNSPVFVEFLLEHIFRAIRLEPEPENA